MKNFDKSKHRSRDAYAVYKCSIFYLQIKNSFPRGNSSISGKQEHPGFSNLNGWKSDESQIFSCTEVVSLNAFPFWSMATFSRRTEKEKVTLFAIEKRKERKKDRKKER